MPAADQAAAMAAMDPTKTPLAANPSGAPPNFVDPPSLEGSVFAVGLVLSIVSTVFVALRLYTNWTNARRLALADYLCTFALVTMISYYALIASVGESARHTWDVPMSMLTPSYLKRIAAENFIIGPTLWASKAAILALYIQLFGKTHHWLRWTSYIALILSFCFYWANTPLTGVFCVPKASHDWDMSLMASCSKLAIMAPLQGAIGLAADLFILVLPIPIVWGLNLPPRKKAGVLMVFCAGTFAIIASTISLYYRVIVWFAHDPLWNGTKITITTFVEGFVTIIVSCAPAMSSFWLNIVTKSNFYSSITSRRASTSNTINNTEKRADSDNSSEFSRRRQSPASNSEWYGSSNYEQTDAFYGKLSTTTEVHSYEVDITISRGEFITKQTSLDQSSERASR